MILPIYWLCIGDKNDTNHDSDNSGNGNMGSLYAGAIENQPDSGILLDISD